MQELSVSDVCRRLISWAFPKANQKEHPQSDHKNLKSKTYTKNKLEVLRPSNTSMIINKPSLHRNIEWYKQKKINEPLETYITHHLIFELCASREAIHSNWGEFDWPYNSGICHTAASYDSPSTPEINSKPYAPINFSNIL